MTDFASLVNDVMTITNRPDLVELTKLAVRNATLRVHASDLYPKDIMETGIRWPDPAYIQSLEYRTFFPSWRAFKYLRKFDYSIPPGAAGDFFQLITPAEVIDNYGYQRSDVCYQAGSFIEIKSSTQDEYMLIGFYVNPDVSELTYNSWIANDYPYAIQYSAARDIFGQIGYDEQARIMFAQETDAINLLKQELSPGGN